MTIMAFMWGDVTDDVLTLVGLGLTLIGFGLTFIGVWKAQSAATAAKDAVKDVRKDIQRIDAVAEISSALRVIEEIQRLQRQKKWDLLPDRYLTLRQSLIEIRGANADLTDDNKAALQSSIVIVRGIMDQVEETLESEADSPKVAKLNSTLSEQADDLQVILTEVRTQIGA